MNELHRDRPAQILDDRARDPDAIASQDPPAMERVPVELDSALQRGQL
jgi:hypothetical protein